MSYRTLQSAPLAVRSEEWPAWFSFWFPGAGVLAGACQIHGVGGFLLRNYHPPRSRTKRARPRARLSPCHSALKLDADIQELGASQIKNTTIAQNPPLHERNAEPPIANRREGGGGGALLALARPQHATQVHGAYATAACHHGCCCCCAARRTSSLAMIAAFSD